MSFGPSQAQKNANNQQNAITGTALTDSSNLNNLGSGILNTGTQNVTSGTNFFNSILNGNQANTTATLQPSIDQIRGTTQQNLQALTTLSPRGGGRSGTLFGTAMAPAAGIQSLYNNARTAAATTLPTIGLQQEGIGTNLFGLGNQALGTGSSSNANLSQSLNQQQQIANQAAAGLGSGLFSLLTAPLGIGGAAGGAGSALGGLIRLCWIAEAIYGINDRRTHILRAWLNGPYRRTRTGSAVMKVYALVGRRVARIPVLCRMLRPLFEMALASATRTSTFVEVG